MGMFGKSSLTPEQAQARTEKWQKIGAALKDVGANLNGDPGDALAAYQAQRQKMAQEQQQQQAMAALMARMRGPDTQTPVVNQMIDMNNQRMGSFQNGMEHQQGRMDVTKPGLPMDQETMSLLAKYGAAGGNMQIPLAMSQMMQPDVPKLQSFGADEDIYQIGADGMPTMLRPGSPKARPAPSGYEWTADGKLKFIAGGPGDPLQTHTIAESRWRPRVGRAPAAAASTGGGGPWAKYSRGGK